MVAGYRTPILTCSSSSRRRKWRTASPSNVHFLELPPTRRKHRPRRSPNLPLMSSAKHHRHRPRPWTYNLGILHHPTQPHTPRRNTIKTVPPPSRHDPADIVVHPRFPFFFFDCCFAGVTLTWTVLENDRRLPSAFESSEGRFLLLTTTTVMVVFIEFVLRCHVGEDCAVGS